MKRHGRRRKKRQPSRRTLLSRWSRQVRERDGRCIVCGATRYVNSHHLLPKERYRELMYELLNGVSLCPSHHKYGRYSAHRNPIWFVIILKKLRPAQYRWAVRHLGEEQP